MVSEEGGAECTGLGGTAVPGENRDCGRCTVVLRSGSVEGPVVPELGEV